MKALTTDRNKNYGKNMIEIGILIMIANILTAIFIWQSILAGWKITVGKELFHQAFLQKQETFHSNLFNCTTGYLYFLRIIFSFLGNHEELVVISNIVLQFLGICFFYFGSRKIAGIKKAVIFLSFVSLIGAGLFRVTSDTPVHFLWAMLGFFFCLLSGMVTFFYKNRDSKIGVIVLGGIVGVFLYFDISGILLFILLLIFLKKQKKDFLLLFLSFIVTFLLLVSYFYTYMETEVSFILRWLNDQIGFYLDNEEAIKQAIGIGILFFIYYAVHLLSFNKKEIIMVEDRQKEFGENKQNSKKVNSDDRPDSLNQADIKEEKITETMEEDERKVLQVKEIQFLENPLPLPKKHIKKEMNYAFEPPKEQMHFDLNNYDVRDDYDLK